MRSDEILDLKFMAIRTIESEVWLDEHKTLQTVLIKFVDDPILRRENDRFLCDIQTYAVIDRSMVRILNIDSTTNTINVVRLKDKVLFDYQPKDLRLLGFTIDNEPILEYNV
jgi:hypothetical protein